MSEDIRLETNFEHYISRKLQELSNTGDWQVSQNDDGFDPNTEFVMDDFVAYVNAVSHRNRKTSMTRIMSRSLIPKTDFQPLIATKRMR